MGLFNFFRKKKNENKESNYGFVSKEEETGITMTKAQALQEAFLATLHQDSRDQQFNAAARLMTAQAYPECAEAYAILSEKYPDAKGVCLSQIGAAFFFMGDLQKAIEKYLEARDNGMDADMMDDNIWEACEALYRQTNDKIHISNYLEYCPNGNYEKKARKISG